MEPFDMNKKLADKTAGDVQHFEQVCVGLSGVQNMKAAEAELMQPAFFSLSFRVIWKSQFEPDHYFKLFCVD